MDNSAVQQVTNNTKIKIKGKNNTVNIVQGGTNPFGETPQIKKTSFSVNGMQANTVRINSGGLEVQMFQAQWGDQPLQQSGNLNYPSLNGDGQDNQGMFYANNPDMAMMKMALGMFAMVAKQFFSNVNSNKENQSDSNGNTTGNTGEDGNSNGNTADNLTGNKDVDALLKQLITLLQELLGKQGNPEDEQDTESAPSTSAPSTSAPSTSDSAPSAPSTSAPSTSAPSTSDSAPSTPSTSAPSTSAPSTSAPSTSAPATSAPATSAPATSAPAPSAPASSAPASTSTLNVEQARQAVGSTQQAVSQAKGSVSGAEAQLASARGSVGVAEAAFQQANQAVSTMKPGTEKDNAQNALSAAEAKYNTAKAAYDKATISLADAKKALKTAESGLKAAKENLDKAKNQAEIDAAKQKAEEAKQKAEEAKKQADAARAAATSANQGATESTSSSDAIRTETTQQASAPSTAPVTASAPVAATLPVTASAPVTAPVTAPAPVVAPVAVQQADNKPMEDFNTTEEAQKLVALLQTQDTSATQVNQFLDQFDATQRKELFASYKALSGLGSSPSNAIWRGLSNKFDEGAHDIWLNHAIKGYSKDYQFGRGLWHLTEAHKNDGALTNGEMRAVVNFQDRMKHEGLLGEFDAYVLEEEGLTRPALYSTRTSEVERRQQRERESRLRQIAVRLQGYMDKGEEGNTTKALMKMDVQDLALFRRLYREKYDTTIYDAMANKLNDSHGDGFYNMSDAMIAAHRDDMGEQADMVHLWIHDSDGHTTNGEGNAIIDLMRDLKREGKLGDFMNVYDEKHGTGALINDFNRDDFKLYYKEVDWGYDKRWSIKGLMDELGLIGMAARAHRGV